MTRSPRSSPERRLACAALLLAGFVLPGELPAAAQPAAAPPAEVRAKARAALADPRYQRTLPDHTERQGSFSHAKGKPSGSPPEVPVEEEPDSPEVSLPALGAGAFLGRLIFVVLLAVVGVLFVTWIVREIVARRRRSAGPRSAPAAAAVASPLEREPSFDDASGLAAEGRYAEAVHALLLAAIRHFAERSRTAVQPSRTSRELVRLLPLGPETREAFAELVRTVELSLFGGGSVGAEDYERNLARFQALTRRSA